MSTDPFNVITWQSKPPPDLSRSLQVIGAGMGRTGTVSFTLALELLLNGPVAHTGSGSLAREEAWIKKWIAVCNAQEGRDDEYVRDTLRDLLAGYVGVTDTPGVMFVRELVEMFPDAPVIVTTRDPDRWWESMKELMETVQWMWVVNAIFWPMPTLRYFNAWMHALTKRSKQIYHSDGVLRPEHLANHMAYVKRNVPADRLFYFDVKDGWGPLCKILNCPIPDVPFPHANDKLAVQEALTGLMKAALMRWLGIFAVVGAGIAMGFYLRR